MTLVLIHADTEHEWNCSQWRIVNPAYGLKRIGVDVDVMTIQEWSVSHTDPVQMKRIDKASAVLLQRNVFGPSLQALEHWRKLDKPVWIDLDDAYNMLPRSNSAYQFWNENVYKMTPDPLAQLRYGLEMASGLTSPSKLILTDWKTPATRWLPNHVRAEWYQKLERRPHDGVIIGWGGSMSHRDSFRYSGVVAALERVCRERPYVRIVVCGNDFGNFEMLRSIAPAQRAYMPGVAPAEWPGLLSQFDIGIAPLWSEYDRRRSWLKVVEYACAGVPCIATKSDPYADLSDWATLIENGPESWYAALDSTLSKLPEAQSLATKRRVEAVLAFSIESKAGMWVEGLR